MHSTNHSISSPLHGHKAEAQSEQSLVGGHQPQSETKEEPTETRAHLEAFFHSISDAIIFADRDRRIVSINPAMTKMFGYTIDELRGKTTECLYSDRKDYELAGKRLYYAEPLQNCQLFELELCRKDGTIFRAESSGAPVFDKEHRHIGFVGIHRDISERRRAIEEILNIARFPTEDPNPVMRVSKDGKLMYANPASRQLLKSLRWKLGKKITDEWCDRIAECHDTACRMEVETKGGDAYYSVAIAPIRGASYVNLYATDITKRKQMETELRWSEARFRSIFDTNVVPIAYCHLDGRILDANYAYLQLIGYTREELESGMARWDGIASPERKPMDDMVLSQLRREGICPPLEREFCRRDGTRAPVLIGATLIPGYPDQAVVFAVDLSERKRTEDELRKAHGELELRVRERTTELARTNVLLEQEIVERTEIARSITASNTLLKLLSNAESRKEYLEKAVHYLQEWSGCECVGIRVLDEDGRIPYEAYTGFSEEFWRSENGIILGRDTCACTRVLAGAPEPQDMPFMTSGGSFHCGNIAALPETMTPEEQSRFRGVCIRSGFASVAIIPISSQGMIRGVIHLADRTRERVPARTVELLESLAPLVGEALYKFATRDMLQQQYNTQNIINSLLRLSLENVDLQTILEQSLDQVLAAPWLFSGSTGAVYLVEGASGSLVMRAQRSSSPEVARSPGPTCAEHAKDARLSGDSTQEIARGQRHYRIPLLHSDKLLGIIEVCVDESHIHSRKAEELLTAVAHALAGIVHRKQLEKLMNRYEKAVESANDLILIHDSHYVCLLANDIYLKYYGLERSQILGHTIADIVGEDVFEAVIKPKFDQCLSGSSVQFEMSRTYPSLGKRHMLACYSPLKDEEGETVGVVTILTDITERKKAEKSVEEQAALLELAHDAILVRDMEDRLIYWNRGAEETYGWLREDVLGKSALDLLGTHLPESSEEIRARLASEGRWEGELRHLRSDGKPIVVASRWALQRDSQGEPGAILEINRDVTKRIAAEEALRAYTAKLERVNRELQEFAFVASHDLQEPLRKIQAFGDMLNSRFKSFLGEEGSDYIHRMIGAAARMQDLLQALLSYSRVTTRVNPFQPVHLEDLLRDVASDLEIALKQAEGRIEIQNLPVVYGDKPQLRQLFQNLISNGLKYCRKAERPVIRIEGRVESDVCRILVQDNGLGFDERYLEKIFQPFQRLHGRNSVYPGTGIGLAICRKIVERHSGSITATSTPGKGSTFIVQLPACR